MFNLIVTRGILNVDKAIEYLELALQTEKKRIFVNDIIICFDQYYVEHPTGIERNNMFMVNFCYHKKTIISMSSINMRRLAVLDTTNNKIYDFTNIDAFDF